MTRRSLYVVFMTALLLLGRSSLRSATAPSGAIGTWIFHVTVEGAPSCECTQILTLHPDSTLDGPGNDQFTGQARGLWSMTGANKLGFILVQNSFKHDGSAAGIYTIKAIMSFAGPNSGNGTSAFTLTDNAGKELDKGTASFTATRLQLTP